MLEPPRREGLDRTPEVPSTDAAVPLWLQARRAKSASEMDSDEIEFAEASPDLHEDLSEPGIEFQPAAPEADDQSLSESSQSAAVPPLPTESAAPVDPEVTRPPELPATQSAVPNSASRPPQLRGRTRTPVGPIIIAAPEAPLEKTWSAWFWRQVRSAAATGLLMSTLIHLVALTTLGVLVFEGRRIGNSLELFGGMSQGTELSEIELDSTLEDAGGNSAPLELPDVLNIAESGMSAFSPGETLSGALDGTGLGTGSGSSNGDGTGTGSQIAVPQVGVPTYAVRKGSFAAWTEPRDPRPGFSYEIVIQFKLPPDVKTYRGSDLTGMVTGTDGYKQAIRFSRTQQFEVKNGSVQIRVRVPGADQLVRDTIRVESRLLREKQVLEIVF